MKNKYNLNDISVVIPTYNRAEDLRITLDSIKSHLIKIKEVIIVDQSKNDSTKELIRKLKNSRIKYIFSKIPAITIARNMGIKNSDKNSKFVCFLDDDVSLGNNYFEGIIKLFNEHDEAKAVAAYFKPEKINFFENILRKIFFIRYLEKDRARIISAYGNTYPSNLGRVINVEWLPGVNMVYKKDIFKEQIFDENLLGYTIAEDIDFSYRLYKKYPNALFITPFAKIEHRASTAERYPTEKMAYVNQQDHFYFNFKNLNKTFVDKIKFGWCLFGITFLRILNLAFKPRKINYLKMLYFFKSLYYCIKTPIMLKTQKR